MDNVRTQTANVEAALRHELQPVKNDATADYSHLPDLRSDETKETDRLHAEIASLRAQHARMKQLWENTEADLAVAKSNGSEEIARLRAELTGVKADRAEAVQRLNDFRGDNLALRAELALEKSENDKMIGLLDKARAAARQDADKIARLRDAAELALPIVERHAACAPVLVSRELEAIRTALACRPQEKSHGA